MDDAVKICISTDAGEFSRYATLLASIVRRTHRNIWVKCYTKGFEQHSFQSRNLRVDFIHLDESPLASFNSYDEPASFDKLQVIEDGAEWDRCILLENYMICLGDIGELYDQEFEGSLLAAVEGGYGLTIKQAMALRGGVPEALSHTGQYRIVRPTLVLNLAKMREEQIWNELANAHSLLRQDAMLALVAAVRGDTRAISSKWCQIPQVDFKSPDSKTASFEEPIGGIIAWSGFGRPWRSQAEAWYPEIWEAERSNWSLLREGDWDKPVMCYFPAATASELLGLFSQGWLIYFPKNALTLSEPSAGASEAEATGVKVDQSEQTRRQLLAAHPDFVFWEDQETLESAAGGHLAIYRDFKQLKSFQVLARPRYILIKEAGDPELAEKLRLEGYEWQLCRPTNQYPIPVAEGADYALGRWDFPVEENSEFLAWDGRSPLDC